MIAKPGLRIEAVEDDWLFVGKGFYDFSSPKERDSIYSLVSRVHKNSIKHYGLPYVWGGNSPSRAIAHLKSMAGRKQMEGSWRAGQPLVPGFDCSGWVQYNFRSILGLPSIRKVNCAMLKDHTRTSMALPDDNYSASDLREASVPGDLMFISDPEREEYGNHVAIVLGDGLLSESAGEKNPDYVNIPKTEWAEWRSYALGSNGKKDIDRGGVQIASMDNYEGKKSSLYRLDF